MVKDAAVRKKKYESGIDPELTRRKIEGVKPVMVALESDYFAHIAEYERKIKRLCEKQGVTTIAVGQYLNYGRQLYSLTRKFTSVTLVNETTYLAALWASRGYIGSLLQKIAKLFGVDIAAPAEKCYLPCVHGAEKHTDVTRERFIPAFNDSAANTTLIALDYGSAIRFAAAQIAGTFFYFKVPDDFVSFVSIKLVWVSGAESGNMRWRSDAQIGAKGEVYYEHLDETAEGETATAGADIINEQESPNPLTMTALAKGDYIGVRVMRDATDPNDTLNAAVDVLGILFTYVAEQ